MRSPIGRIGDGVELLRNLVFKVDQLNGSQTPKPKWAPNWTKLAVDLSARVCVWIDFKDQRPLHQVHPSRRQ